MDPYERKQDILRMREMLREQRERVTSSKEEAEKFLTGLGIMHLLVPIKAHTSKIRRPKKTSKVKLVGK
jgi:hypothetical protein